MHCSRLQKFGLSDRDNWRGQMLINPLKLVTEDVPHLELKHHFIYYKAWTAELGRLDVDDRPNGIFTWSVASDPANVITTLNSSDIREFVCDAPGVFRIMRKTAQHFTQGEPQVQDSYWTRMELRRLIERVAKVEGIAL